MFEAGEGRFGHSQRRGERAEAAPDSEHESAATHELEGGGHGRQREWVARALVDERRADPNTVRTRHDRTTYDSGVFDVEPFAHVDPAESGRLGVARFPHADGRIKCATG